MLLLTKIWKKPESSLSISYENTVTEGTNLRPVKSVHRDERVLSLAEIYKLFHELSQFCLKSMRIRLFASRNTHA